MGALSYVNTRVRVVNLGYKINQELQKKENLIEENKRLSLEIAQLKSPTRIETEAREKLGLRLPEVGQVVYAAKLEEGDLARNLAKFQTKSKDVVVAKQDTSVQAKSVQSTVAKNIESKKSLKNSKAELSKVAKTKSATKAALQVAANKPAKTTPAVKAIASAKAVKNKNANSEKTRILIADRIENEGLSTRPAKQLAQAKSTRNIPATLLDPIP